MRIDDLRLFFKVECILVVLNIGLLVSVTVILFVVREDVLWIRISHKSISTTGCSALWITGRQILD